MEKARRRGRSTAKVLTVPDAEKARLTYDEECDVLCMSFGEPKEATDRGFLWLHVCCFRMRPALSPSILEVKRKDEMS